MGCGCLVGILMAPIRMLLGGLRKLAGYVTHNGWKGIVVGVIAVIFIIWAIGSIRSCAVNLYDTVRVKPPTATTTAATDAPTINEKGIPTVKEARYIAMTESRYYYTDEAVRKPKDVVTLKGYWELFGDTWVKNTGNLILDEKIFGKVRVTTRPK